MESNKNTAHEFNKLNEKLRFAAARRDLGAVVNICQQISIAGFAPTATTYEYILSALAREGLSEECWAVLADMDQFGLPITTSSYNYLLEVRALLYSTKISLDLICSTSRRL